MLAVSKMRKFGPIAAALALSTLLASTAYGADPRYDESKANINKAIALLKAVESTDEKPAAKRHREQAIARLEDALKQIDRAKAAADGTVKKDKHKGDKHKDHHD